MIGTHTISQECKIRLAFIGHVLAEACHSHAEAGTIVNVAGDASRIPLTKLIPKLGPIIDTLKAWRVTLPAQPPPVVLKDHCPICPFKKACLDQAEKEDNLSLLDRMTPKVMRKYHKKGIFTVNQLSYLFKPRRQRKKRAHVPSGFNIELQALALRTAKIYVHQPPVIPVHPVELSLISKAYPIMELTTSLASSSRLKGMSNAIPYVQIHLKTSEISSRHSCVLSKNILTLPSITTAVTSQRLLSRLPRNMALPVTQ